MIQKKIVLGLGNNIDYEVKWDSIVLESLINKYDVHENDLISPKEIKTEKDLLLSILTFLKEGTGGERFVCSAQTIEDFSAYFQKKVTLGGTSVRAALAMEKFGVKSDLHLVTMNDDVKKLLPKNCNYICSATQDSCYPHLIIQYGAGTKIKANDIDIISKRSNRLIYVNDKENSLMALNSNLSELLKDANVFLISGFNAMQDQHLLLNRLNTVIESMTQLPKDAVVFYEDGCYHNDELKILVKDMLFDKITVFSMNEDELQEYVGKKIDLLCVDEVKSAIDKVLNMLKVPILVIHTQYYALIYGENAKDYIKSLQSGILMAATRFKYGDDFTVSDYENMKNNEIQPSSGEFAAKINDVFKDKLYCIPCYQLDESNATTIGLGDSFVGGFILSLAQY